MPTYLTKIEATYYYRRPVPPPLQRFFLTRNGKPKTEWMESLRVKDRRAAEQALHRRNVEVDELIREAEARLLAMRADPAARRRAQAEWEEFKAQEEGAQLAFLEAAEEDEAMFAREPQRRAIIDRLNKPRAEMSPAELAFRDLIPDEEFASVEERERRAAQIRADEKQGAAEAAEWFLRQREAAPAPAAPSDLMVLFDRYVAERKPAPASVKAFRRVMQHLIDAGHSDPRNLTAQDVVRWKDGLLAEKDEKGEPARGAGTVRETYLAALKVVLGFGVENGELAANVAKEVTVRAPKKVRLREPQFSNDEAATILRAALAPQPGDIAPEHRLARRWVPWLCAYTGARVNEMTQLRAQDVRKVEGVWTLRITPEAGSVKNNQARVVPLHEHLIEQGFLAVAEAKEEGPLFYDPARGRGGKDANPHHKKMGERLAAWVRKIGVDDPNVQPNHAWRHLFKAISRRPGCRMDPHAVSAITGHAHSAEGDKYGAPELPVLAEELKRFPRFKLEEQPA